MYVIGIKYVSKGQCSHGHKRGREKAVVLAHADIFMGKDRIERVLCPTCLNNLMEKLVDHPLGQIIQEIAHEKAAV